MKIAGARASAVVLRFARPVRTSRGLFAERSSVILELQDDQGLCGYGEAAPWPGFGTESAVESLDVLRRTGELFGAADREPAEWMDFLATEFESMPAARSALEGALWDLASRRLRRPLAEVLVQFGGVGRGPALHQVPASVLLMETAPEALLEEATRARAAGHRAAKLKLGAGALGEDVVRARAARDGLGPGIALRGDANGAWTESEALAALVALAEFDFAYVEQPVPADAIDALARLRRVSPLRIAADESVSTEARAARVIEAGAADVVVLKPASLGGPVRTLGLAARARESGCEVVFTHSFESAVGARHALHCAAAWADADAVHGLVTQGLFERDVAEPVACRDGVCEVPRTPGLGIQP